MKPRVTGLLVALLRPPKCNRCGSFRCTYRNRFFAAGHDLSAFGDSLGYTTLNDDYSFYEGGAEARIFNFNFTYNASSTTVSQLAAAAIILAVAAIIALAFGGLFFSLVSFGGGLGRRIFENK